MNPPVEAPASRTVRPDTSTPKRSSAASSFSPPRDANRRAGRAMAIDSSGMTSMLDLAAGRPPTLTLPDRMALVASERLAAIPRRTISTSRRRRTSPRIPPGHLRPGHHLAAGIIRAAGQPPSPASGIRRDEGASWRRSVRSSASCES